ncbi:MAG: transcriptional repressor LexA [Ruminococcaceae bacterium]|nr:transcriptional repressor LexA [Oscillospiraceae bacterium]
MVPLTPKEQLIFDYIKENLRKNGYSPSIRDIRTALDIKSTSTVHTYLERLERKGYIHKENGKSRTLRIEDAMGDGIDVNQNGRVPILGKVTAGQPILAVENYEGFISYPEGEGRSHDAQLFALRVTGSSMIEAGILDGDLVIVERTETAENGQIVVALVDDSATVKVFYKEEGHYRLQPRNAAMEPIIVDEVTILGKVLASVRYY